MNPLLSPLCRPAVRLVRLLPLAVAMLPASLLAAPAAQTGEAFGSPGMAFLHAPSAKSFLGTMPDGASHVYFTGYRGILSEVFYPSVDASQSVDLQFLVGDRAGRFVDEEKLQPYSARQTDRRTMSWQVETGNPARNWRITKRIFASPDRHAVIERVTFTALNGLTVKDFNLYLLFKPSLGNSGSGNSAMTLDTPRGTVLAASRQDRHSVLVSSLGWREIDGRKMLSSGFAGASDGWSDLLRSADHRMDWTFASASNGNVAQMGWLDTANSTARSISFDVVLAFGNSRDEAVDGAFATLGADLARLQQRYDDAWHRYAGRLSTQGGSADDRYYLAAMTLKTMQDKNTGAMVAGLGTPWGETQGEANPGGYHLVWPRDLYKFANALHTAGDQDASARVVRYLFRTLQQKNDCGRAEYDAPGCSGGFSRAGRFPQNAWVGGWQYWQGTQMDEQAMPILLAWRLGDAVSGPLWPQIRLTADYIVATGPRTMQERWEENDGYSPSTLAAEIAGLVAAADIARKQGDVARAVRYLASADRWQQNLDAWTYTRTGPLPGGQYYLRINPSPAGADGAPQFGPDAGQMLTVANGGGSRDARGVIDSGFMELVRMGVKRADDPAIVRTAQAFDQVLGQSLPLAGVPSLPYNAWFRYNYDGYGEHNDGRNYDGNGRGRLWPILTAERGMLEIARQGRGAAGAPYLAALGQLATPEGFLPEQVWSQSTVLPGGWAVTTPTDQQPGRPSRSIAPLNWAMGEYINLLSSIRAGRVVDMPAVVCARYHTCAQPAGEGEATVELSLAGVAPGRWYVTGDGAALGGWNTGLGLPLSRGSDGIWRQRVHLPAGQRVSYRYYRKQADGSVVWERAPGSRVLQMPANGAVRRDDTGG